LTAKFAQTGLYASIHRLGGDIIIWRGIGRSSVFVCHPSFSPDLLLLRHNIWQMRQQMRETGVAFLADLRSTCYRWGKEIRDFGTVRGRMKPWRGSKRKASKHWQSLIAECWRKRRARNWKDCARCAPVKSD